MRGGGKEGASLGTAGSLDAVRLSLEAFEVFNLTSSFRRAKHPPAELPPSLPVSPHPLWHRLLSQQWKGPSVCRAAPLLPRRSVRCQPLVRREGKAGKVLGTDCFILNSALLHHASQGRAGDESNPSINLLFVPRSK